VTLFLLVVRVSQCKSLAVALAVAATFHHISKLNHFEVEKAKGKSTEHKLSE
jgi:hypothetical protein